MNIEAYREYCLSLGADVEEKLPFVKFKNSKPNTPRKNNDRTRENVVTRDISANSIAVGNPAKVIKTIQ